jgi:hypothetical protein
MKLALYGILVILALFIVLMVFNPNLSCFGRKLRSPFYPVLRKKKLKQKKREAMDYGFNLGGPGEKRGKILGTGSNTVTEDYGFDLGRKSAKKIRTD